jgi:thioredoxin 1
MMAPVLENLAREVGGKLQVVKLDVDANPRTAGSFGIMGIPTMILFKDGKEADRLVGYMPLSTLRSKLSKTLDLN